MPLQRVSMCCQLLGGGELMVLSEAGMEFDA